MNRPRPLPFGPSQLRDAIALVGSVRAAADLLRVNARTLERRLKSDPALRRAYEQGKADHEAARPHGTLASYRYRPMPDGTYGCRCPECRGANREYTRRCRESRLAREVPAHVHGTTSGYINWGCRCDPCRAAGSENNRLQRQRRLARANRQ